MRCMCAQNVGSALPVHVNGAGRCVHPRLTPLLFSVREQIMKYVDGIMTIMTFMSHHYIPVVNPQVFVHTPGYISCCHATHHHSSVRDNPDLGISLYGNTRLRDERCDVNELLWYRPVMYWSCDLQPAQGAVGMQHLWQPLLTPPSLLTIIATLTRFNMLLDSPISEILKVTDEKQYVNVKIWFLGCSYRSCRHYM